MVTLKTGVSLSREFEREERCVFIGNYPGGLRNAWEVVTLDDRLQYVLIRTSMGGFKHDTPGVHRRIRFHQQVYSELLGNFRQLKEICI
jgi:hypothetical protein